MDATTLVSEFNALLLQLSSAFTQPTAETFRQLATGWLLTPAPGTVTGMIRTLGAWANKHWTVYEKFFYRARWSVDRLGYLVLSKLIAPLLGDHVDLVIDDTTCGPRGRHVALAGWYKDASAKAKHTVIHWAHNWVIGAVMLRVKRLPLLRLSLPVLFSLYRKRCHCDRDHPFATRQQLALQMVKQLAQVLPGKQIRLAFDGIFATKDFFGDLPPNVNAVSRLRKNAALYGLIPPQPRKRRGRRRKRGAALPPPRQIAQQAERWQQVTLLKQGREVRRRIYGLTCLWYHVCKSEPVRVLIIRDPSGREDENYVVCSAPSVPDIEIAQRYYDRWGIEECIEQAKQQMGMERTRGWCARTVSRQAPMAMLLTTLVKLWYVLHGVKATHLRPDSLPWYPHKRSVSFRDMLAAIRQAFWRHRIKCNLLCGWKSKEFIKAFTYALCRAA